jgi:hypothetical protein
MGVREVALERLEDQIGWYDRRSRTNRCGYRSCKVIELVAAALVAVSPGLVAVQKEAPLWPYVVSGLGALITALLGLQHLYQFHTNYVSYRATCEALRREKHLYFAGAGPYADALNPERLLAERVEALTSSENTQWVSAALQPAQPEKPASGGAGQSEAESVRAP